MRPRDVGADSLTEYRNTGTPGTRPPPRMFSMNVCMDLQAALGQRGGIGRYVRELFRHLGAEADEGETLTGIQ